MSIIPEYNVGDIVNFTSPNGTQLSVIVYERLKELDHLQPTRPGFRGMQLFKDSICFGFDDEITSVDIAMSDPPPE